MKLTNKIIPAFIVALSCLTSFTASAADQKLVVKDGEKIAFLGDSITAAGNRKNGYIKLVMGALKAEGLTLTHVPAGKAGNKSNDMLGRLQGSVLKHNPDWMVLSCGVNDVWHYTLKLGNRTFKGVSLEDYKKNIGEIIKKAEAEDVKILILTTTMIGEDPKKETNKKLIPYNDFLREIAKDKKLLIADLSEDMHEQLKKMPDVKGKANMFGDPKYVRNIKNKLTSDGCHMNKLGNIMMAKGVLRALGLSEKKIKAAEAAWLGK